jgi:hypothetical protein
MIGGRLLELYRCPECEDEYADAYSARSCCPQRPFYRCSVCRKHIDDDAEKTTEWQCDCDEPNEDGTPARPSPQTLERCGQTRLALHV